MRLLKKQQSVANDHFDTTVFLEGPAGTGKTTAAIERIKNLIRSGVPAESILVLAPQAALTIPYREALRRSRVKTGGDIHSTTIGRLAFEMVDLFWPLVADESGVSRPLRRPQFLSLEMVQYYMKRFVEPEIERHQYFREPHISRNRLYTQIVDNLNKAALVGFPYEEISQRLIAASGNQEPEQIHIYNDAQACATLFRQKCLEHNLLDFSLQIELFLRLWQTEPHVRRYLIRRYRHLIVDNLEEDTPATHDIVWDWLAECESAVLIYDTEAGYRRFLGADPVYAYGLKERCAVHVALDNHRVMSPDVEAFQIEMARSLKPDSIPETVTLKGDARSAIDYPDLGEDDNRFFTQLLDWTADHIASLIHNEGVPPAEIVVLSAFLPDALRFSLQTRLDERAVPHRSHRPSRALREEPAVRALMTLAKLAHPDWGMAPGSFDVTYALKASIAEFDLVRARLLADVLYRQGELHPFERIQDARVQNRITFELGARYEKLRGWLDAYRQSDPLPLDAFFSKLFGEVLSQPKFGFHQDFDAANVAANLIDSAREFRQTTSRVEPELAAAPEYIRMVDSGVIANQYVRNWTPNKKEDAVLLTPAYTFLMVNQPVDYQFWLNIGSSGWGQRLQQPLTQPYVLSRQWPDDAVWSDEWEFAVNQESLYRMVLGLVRRCRRRIYLGFSQYGEQGFEQRGSLLMAVHGMLRRLAKEERVV
ncbi:MAG TPA: UvrD-helicase domain-containing protein [Spirillospora sp.]|nr:UvrD-helicase domain-containing protein [Spirillospora sp.]